MVKTFKWKEYFYHNFAPKEKVANTFSERRSDERTIFHPNVKPKENVVKTKKYFWPQSHTKRKSGIHVQMKEVFFHRNVAPKENTLNTSNIQNTSNVQNTSNIQNTSMVRVFYSAPLITTQNMRGIKWVMWKKQGSLFATFYWTSVPSFCSFHFLKQSENLPDMTLEGAKKIRPKRILLLFCHFLM